MFRRDKKIAFIQNDYAVKVNNHYKTKFENEIKEFKEVKFQVGILMTEMEKVKEENETLKKKYEELEAEVKQLKELKTKENVTSPSSGLISNQSSNNFTITHPIAPTKVQPYLDITIDGVSAGRLKIDLFTTDAPNTCNKFVKLCTGERGISYKDDTFKLLSGSLCMAGVDLTETSGIPFPQDLNTPKENVSAKHSKRGLVSMSTGTGRAGSQIILLFASNKFIHSANVVFGQLTNDSLPALKRIEETPRDGSTPKKEIKITSCGVLGL